MIAITAEPINTDQVLQAVASPEAGALDLFVGTVRNNGQSKQVVRLEYECYEKMAIKEMQKIIADARTKWPILKVAAIHRVGILGVGEVAVAVAVSTPHRKEAFESCQYIIDTLKATVPIWKKEVYHNGESWVSAHP